MMIVRVKNSSQHGMNLVDTGCHQEAGVEEVADMYTTLAL